MRHSKLLLLCALATLCVFFWSAAGFGAPVKYKTSGAYTDAAGGQHPWSINDSHTLIWDGEPYIPVGGAFVSRYISEGATEKNYGADVSALETLKSKGITDIVLKSTGPITSVDPAALQKLINYLDANGFRYGIEMNDGPKDPLKGYVIAPNAYMLQGPYPETTISCDWPDVDSAIFVVLRRYDLSIQANGGAVVKDGKVKVYLPQPLAAGEALVIYPHKSYKPVTDGGIGDIWSGFGEYRDRVLAFFASIKLGPGMRFFLEPFAGKMDFTDEMLGFVPDSAGFRLGFEAYLAKIHTHEGTVNAVWGLNDNLDKIETAARLIPMWTSKGGVPDAYDRASARLYPVDTTVSRMWQDLINYRDASAQEYMNTIADAIKKHVADVPVIFKNAAYHRVYANPYGIGGFDGLGAVAYGSAETPVTTVAGPAYSLAEGSAKTTWFITAATATTDANKLLVGYPSQNVMNAALDYFREIGCKGFYVDSLQAISHEKSSTFSLLNDPQQLDWLKAFKDKIDVRSWTDFKPNVVYYPANIPTGAYVKRLARDTWWLPTLRSGKTSFIGDGLSAYAMAGEDRAYLWSNSGDRTITLKVPPTGTPSIAFPEGSKLAARRGGQFTVSLDDSPTVLRGMDMGLVFPYEVAQAEIDRLAQLIPEADKQGMSVQQERTGLDRAKTVIKNDQPMIAHSIAQKCIQDLLKSLGADMWVEGEEPSFYYFGSPAAAPGASDGRALVLDTTADPPLSPYQATFRFSPPVNASYEIWIAATPPSEGSPMLYSVDDTNWLPLAAQGDLHNYAAGLAWYKIGSVNAFPGNQSVEFKADGRRSQDNRYYFAIDAIVLSPKGFTPNGVMKPF